MALWDLLVLLQPESTILICVDEPTSKVHVRKPIMTQLQHMFVMYNHQWVLMLVGYLDTIPFIVVVAFTCYTAWVILVVGKYIISRLE